MQDFLSQSLKHQAGANLKKGISTNKNYFKSNEASVCSKHIQFIGIKLQQKEKPTK